MKRKGPPEAASAGDNKRARPSTPVDDELEDEGEDLAVGVRSLMLLLSSRPSLSFLWSPDRDRDAAEVPIDDSKADADSLAAKRRHSRPAELDSEGEEEEEEEEADTSEKEEESLSDRDEESDIREAAKRLLAAKVSQLSLYGWNGHFD